MCICGMCIARIHSVQLLHYQLVTKLQPVTTLFVAACARGSMSGGPGRWTRRARPHARCQCSAPAGRSAWLLPLPRTPCRSTHVFKHSVHSLRFLDHYRAQTCMVYAAVAACTAFGALLRFCPLPTIRCPGQPWQSHAQTVYQMRQPPDAKARMLILWQAGAHRA